MALMLIDPLTSRVVFRHHFKGNKNFHHKSKRSKLSTGPFTHTLGQIRCNNAEVGIFLSLCVHPTVHWGILRPLRLVQISLMNWPKMFTNLCYTALPWPPASKCPLAPLGASSSMTRTYHSASRTDTAQSGTRISTALGAGTRRASSRSTATTPSRHASRPSWARLPSLGSCTTRRTFNRTLPGSWPSRCSDTSSRSLHSSSSRSSSACRSTSLDCNSNRLNDDYFIFLDIKYSIYTITKFELEY